MNKTGAAQIGRPQHKQQTTQTHNKMVSITLCLRNRTVTVSATNVFGMNSTDQIVCADEGAASLLVLTDSNEKVTAVLHGSSGVAITNEFPTFTVSADDLIRSAKRDGWNGVCNCLGI